MERIYRFCFATAIVVFGADISLALCDDKPAPVHNNGSGGSCVSAATSGGMRCRLWRSRRFSRSQHFRANFGESHSTAIQYDGLYQSEDKDQSEDRDTDAWYYLRFFEDGTVLSVTSTGTPEDLAPWFNKQHRWTSKGTYAIAGNRIRFSTTLAGGYHKDDGVESWIEEVIVDYVGIVLQDGRLRLNSCSHYNGHRATTTYRFVKEKRSRED